jgi:hypothetical protein
MRVPENLSADHVEKMMILLRLSLHALAATGKRQTRRRTKREASLVACLAASLLMMSHQADRMEPHLAVNRQERARMTMVKMASIDIEGEDIETQNMETMTRGASRLSHDTNITVEVTVKGMTTLEKSVGPAVMQRTSMIERAKAATGIITDGELKTMRTTRLEEMMRVVTDIIIGEGRMTKSTTKISLF